MKLLTLDLIPSIFGQVTPPPGMDVGGSDPVAGLAKIIGFGINLFIIVAGIFMLIYLLWGAFDWIVSSGEKEKITKAQNKITNAVIGMIIIFVVLVVFNLLAGQMLGIVKTNPDGSLSIGIPTLK